MAENQNPSKFAKMKTSFKT
jgi:hypothetical protein